MKKRNQHTGNEAGKWADDVLSSIDGIARAKANPFLFTRIKARIDERYGIWEKMANFIAKPAFAFASIAFFVAINIGVIILGQNRQSAQLAAKSTLDQMLAAEFVNTQSYSLVDLNEEK
jgi:hypothetical protein